MAVKYKHSDVYSMYFCTFTCYHWLPLFEQTNSYDLIYSWFNILNKQNIQVIGYVIMPNHVHCILYFPDDLFDLNKILTNGKRFMAYEIINRIENLHQENTLRLLKNGITEREKKKKQLHKVFKDSFDAKPIFSERFFTQKLHYMHYNPVSGKWKLVDDFVSYEHSSASFYETGVINGFTPKHFRDL